MSNLTPKQRLKIALGGFLSFIGLAVLIFAFLVAIQQDTVRDIVQSDFARMLIGVTVVLGSLDILAGILLLRSR